MYVLCVCVCVCVGCTFALLYIQLSYYEYKLSVMQEVIADEIAELCDCYFTFSNVDQDKLECISGSTNSLNYTGRLTSKTDQDSASLVASLEGWASEEPTVSVEGE